MSAVVERNSDYNYNNGSVRTRISWGAILAGAAVSMAIYTLLMSLGVAVGMSVNDDVNARALGTGAGVWGFISLLIALFAGGWVTTQLRLQRPRQYLRISVCCRQPRHCCSIARAMWLSHKAL